MHTTKLACLSLSLVALSACRPEGDGAQPCGSLEPRSADEVALCNELDQAVLATLALPEGEPPATGWPAVVVLHGSGGLHHGDEDECSVELQDQFESWRDILTAEGYAVIMPDSFMSRGFCEWDRKRFIPRELTEHERLIVRVFDARAAATYMCDHPDVDCDRLALLGFSNGGSTTLLTMQDDYAVTADERLREHGALPIFTGAVAYYPGCAMQEELTMSTAAADLDGFYAPLAPVVVQAAERDELVEDCSEVRNPQVEAIDAARGRGDFFTLNVYDGAEHGFDSQDGSKGQGAREAALADTLAHLAEFFE